RSSSRFGRVGRVARWLDGQARGEDVAWEALVGVSAPLPTTGLAYPQTISPAKLLAAFRGKTGVGIKRQNLMSGDTMSPLVAARRAETQAWMPPCCPPSRLGVALDYPGLRHLVFGSVVPSHTSGYAAPPLRSDTLTVTAGCHPGRQSFELTRLAPVGDRWS